jgi:nucleoside-diphosphate-sugar epimerase
MRILVAGGGSFIGAYAIRRLLRDGHEVVVYDVNIHDNAIHRILDPSDLRKIIFVRGDVTDGLAVVSACLEHRIDNIVHLAAALIPECANHPAYGVRVNCDGLNHSFEAARLLGVRRVVWASSIAVYGPRTVYAQDWLDEDAPHYPTTVYGACKSLNEFMGRHYFERFGVDNIGLRFTVVYGPGRLRGAYPYQLNRELIEKPAVGLPGAIPFGDTLIDWQYVEDAARAILVALYHPQSPRSRVFNTCGDLRTVREAAECVKRILPDATIHVQAGSDPMSIGKIDARKIREELGYQPEYKLEDGLREAINTYRRWAGLPEVGGT